MCVEVRLHDVQISVLDDVVLFLPRLIPPQGKSSDAYGDRVVVRAIPDMMAKKIILLLSSTSNRASRHFSLHSTSGTLRS
jgi:hypothetical protein